MASAFGSFSNNSQSSSSPFGSFGSFGSTSGDLNTTEGLLSLAQQRGGAVAQAANELVHPTTSILSTIGDTLKNTFSDFIDVISTPSEVVAGAISSQYSIADAIKMHIRPSDVIFGSKNPNATTMQKIGNFFVRTATDVMLDPLTYLTFGAGSGSIFGARAAETLSIADKTGTLNELGQANLDYLRMAARQANGLQSALSVGGQEALDMLPQRLKTFKEMKDLAASGKIAPEVMSQGIDTLKQLLSDSIDSPLNPDFAKKALGTLISNSPALTQTMLDKGGIKYFGKTILSGQRIGAVMELIPGMTWLDHATEQSRLAIGSLFDPSIQGFKQANGATQFVRMPPEYMDLQQKVGDLADYLKEDRVKNLANIMKVNKIDPNTSGQFLMASIENGVMPADKQLARAYTQLLGYNDQQLQYLRGAGIPISYLDNHAPHVLVDSGIKVLPFKMPPPTKVGAAIQRTLEGGIFGSGENAINSMKDRLSTLTEGTPEYVNLSKSIDEAQVAHEAFLAKQPEWEKAVLEGNQNIIKDTVSELKRTGFEIFDDNFFSASLARTMDNIRAGSMKNLVDSLAGNLAAKASDAPAGWVPLNISKFKNENELLVKQGMADSQMVFHPAVARKIEDFTGALYGDEGTKAFLQAYDRIQNVWKASVTSIFPSFHGRNALSNVFLNYNDIGLESLNPVTHTQAAQMIQTEFELNGLIRDSLKEDASNYSEFLRGGSKYDPLKVTDTGVSVTKDERIASNYAGSDILPGGDHGTIPPGEGFVQKLYFPKNANVMKAIDAPRELIQHYRRISMNNARDMIVNYARENGFDAVDFNSLGDAETRIINHNLIRESPTPTKDKISEILSKKVFTDNKGYDWTVGELRSVIKQSNIALKDNIVGQIDTRRTPKEMLDALIPENFYKTVKAGKIPAQANLLSQDFAPFDIGRKFGQMVEGQARMVNFLTNLRKTGNVDLAAARTKQFLFDYNALTPFERTVMKRLFPFYTFTRKNIEAQVSTLLSAPGRTAAQLTFLTNLGDAISGQTLTPEQEAALPDWVKGGINILASKDGNKVSVLQSLGTPIEQPFQQLQSNQVLSSVSPLLRLPIEQMSGYDFFEAKPFSDITNAAALKSAPAFIKDYVGYTDVSFKDKNGQMVNYAVALRPDRLHLILNLPITSRVLSSLKQMEAVDVPGQQRIMQQLIGIRPFSFDLEQEGIKREQEMNQKLQDLLNSAGVGYTLNRFVIPKSK